MKVLLLCQYYWPEEQNVFVHELAAGLRLRCESVMALTAFPHYGKGAVYEGYRGRLVLEEEKDGVSILRTWVYAPHSKRTLLRIANFLSFCCSSLIGGLISRFRPDVIYVSLPPLPLGVTAGILALLKGGKLVLHVQDLYPRAAVEHGILRNRLLIRALEGIEACIYRKAAHIIVISEEFRRHVAERGIASERISVVSNWANIEKIVPGPKENWFRKKLDSDGRFVLTYAGGINHNANLDPVIDAAELLKDEGFVFVIVGDGQFKKQLQAKVSVLRLSNVRFFDFVSEDNYPDVLRAADVNIVTLNNKSAFTSVPSKVYKQMAAARPILAVTPCENELYRLISRSGCGWCVSSGSGEEIAEKLRWAQRNPSVLEEMGRRGRAYVVQHCSLKNAVLRIGEVLGR